MRKFCTICQEDDKVASGVRIGGHVGLEQM
jgi:hypothetical protein